MSEATSGSVSVVIPALNEAGNIATTVASVLRETRPGDEVLVCDGGSGDSTCAEAEAAGARVVSSAPGRGLQMNAGACLAGGRTLLFLHADTLLPAGWRRGVAAASARRGFLWGRFELAFRESSRAMAGVAWMISRRSRAMRSATGDQAIFVDRSWFQAGGGFREARLFEDVELVRRMRREAAPVILDQAVSTSARRWLEHGIARTILTMWTLKVLYLAGVPADSLVRWYGDRRAR